MKNIILLLAVLIMAACSTTITGPVTGNKYNLDVSCTDDMQTYREQRKDIIDGEQIRLDNERDCQTVE